MELRIQSVSGFNKSLEERRCLDFLPKYISKGVLYLCELLHILGLENNTKLYGYS